MIATVMNQLISLCGILKKRGRNSGVNEIRTHGLFRRSPAVPAELSSQMGAALLAGLFAGLKGKRYYSFIWAFIPQQACRLAGPFWLN